MRTRWLTLKKEQCFPSRVRLSGGERRLPDQQRVRAGPLCTGACQAPRLCRRRGGCVRSAPRGGSDTGRDPAAFLLPPSLPPQGCGWNPPAQALQPLFMRLSPRWAAPPPEVSRGYARFLALSTAFCLLPQRKMMVPGLILFPSLSHNSGEEMLWAAFPINPRLKGGSLLRPRQATPAAQGAGIGPTAGGDRLLRALTRG